MWLSEYKLVFLKLYLDITPDSQNTGIDVEGCKGSFIIFIKRRKIKMVGIIVTGHGNFATGLTSSVKLIAGMPDFYQTVDFVAEHSSNDLEANLTEAIEKLKDCEDGILIFTDLVGGSPFKISVELSMKREEKIIVISGTNLGMLIETSMSRNFMEDIGALAQMAVNTGKEQVIRYEFKERVVEEFEDGI